MEFGDRYSRQRQLPEIGEEGQRRLADSQAVIVGCGALGTVQGSLLARAGVGTLVLVDRDCVEPSNLQRQILFTERHAADGVPKAVAARDSLLEANSAVRLEAVIADLTSANAELHLGPADVILDGTDNYETRYLINELAVQRCVPWIYGAAVGTTGSVMPVVPGTTACLSCVFPEAPAAPQPTCDTAGVLNAVTSMVASLQVAEALKILVGRAESLVTRLRTWNPWAGETSSVHADRPDPDCPTCGQRQFPRLAAATPPSAVLCGRDAVQVRGSGRSLDLERLAQRLASLGGVRMLPVALRFDCPPHDITVFPDGRAIIKGTQDLALARSLYARYIGD